VRQKPLSDTQLDLFNDFNNGEFYVRSEEQGKEDFPWEESKDVFKHSAVYSSDECP